MAELPETTERDTDVVSHASDSGLRVNVEQRGPLLIQMWTDYFRHLSNLGVVGSAGLLILLELEMLTNNFLFWMPLAVLAAGSVLSLHGVRTTLALVEDGGGTTKALRFIAGASTLLLGFGAGALTAALMLS